MSVGDDENMCSNSNKNINQEDKNASSKSHMDTQYRAA